MRVLRYVFNGHLCFSDLLGFPSNGYLHVFGFHLRIRWANVPRDLHLNHQFLLQL